MNREDLGSGIAGLEVVGYSLESRETASGDDDPFCSGLGPNFCCRCADPGTPSCDKDYLSFLGVCRVGGEYCWVWVASRSFGYHEWERELVWVDLLRHF